MHGPPPSPPAPASSSPPSSPGGHTRHHSPLPHIATLLPHAPHPHLPHPHPHHSMYSPSSRAADISRLLDPAYASGSSSSGSSTRTRASAWVSPAHRATAPLVRKHTHAQTRAYVDHRGDLHDPDYRDFPVLPTPTRRTRSHNQRKAVATTAAARRSRSASRPRYSPSYALMTRPEWEREWTEPDDDESDDEEDEVTDAESQSHHSLFSSASRASPRRAVTIHTAQPYTSYALYSDYYTDPQPLPFATSPTGSRESPITESPLEDSLFEEDELDAPQAMDRKRKARQSSGRSSVLRKRRAVDSKEDVVIEDGDLSADTEGKTGAVLEKEASKSPHKTRFNNTGEQGDDVPSCSASLRQQWAALSLRIRFGLFHAKRRLTTRTRRRSASDAS